MSYQTRTSLVHPPVALPVETRWTSAFELLIGMFATGTPRESREPSWAPDGLAACPPRTRKALRAIGARAGEVWLHVIGLALDRPGEASGFADLLEATDPIEVRRYLVGEHVPSWREAMGAAALAAAAEGDASAASKLLHDDCYYGGRARESLATLLPLDAGETRARLVEAVRTFEEDVFAPCAGPIEAALEAELARAAELAQALASERLIERLAVGYRYERESGLDDVVLVPHLAARPWLLLCQHRQSRVICYPAAGETSIAERLLRIGRALGDAKRVAILERLRYGEATLQELAAEVGLAKSTVHHHTVLLRAARLVVLKGNASGYVYALEDEGFREAERLFSDLQARPPARPSG
jgi:DNA-binding transcriptional ArsR family regulator